MAVLLRSVGALLLGIVPLAIGLQAALPHSFPWILGGFGLIALVFGIAPMLIALMVVSRQWLVASDDHVVAVRLRSTWRTLDLVSLRGVGADQHVVVASVFSGAVVMRELILVDASGHRLAIPERGLTERLIGTIRGHLPAEIEVTPLAARLLDLN